jgi:protease IV
MSKRWRWIVAIAVLLLALAWWLRDTGPVIEPGSVLVTRLQGEYVEATVHPLLGRLLGQRQQSLVALLSELTKAERDARLAEVVLEIGALDIGWGKADEIRAAVARLSQNGRRTVAYLQVEKLGGNLEYYVASGADEIVIAPAARSPLLGLAAEFLFLGGLFEKIGVDIDYERVGEYKSAVESYAESKMSDANREMSGALLDSIDANFRHAIAEARGLSPQEVQEVIDRGPTTPEQLLELGLVDRVAFLDDVLARHERPRVEGRVYARVDPKSVGFDPQVKFALVQGAGPVVTSESGFSPGGGLVLAADTVAQAIEDAAEAPDVAAIIFRVDSPGGSPLASDIVWRAVRKARQSGKPVVASLSDVAASGGYYVAAGADRIVSQPSTLTGSIGVFVLRPMLGGLFEKLGIGVETMTRGARADLLLSSAPLSPGARAVLRHDVRQIYALFIERVAEGRDMERDDVHAVAQGRVWTGAQALEVGLVDALGGLRTAVLEAKDALGIDPDADVALVPYPPPKPLAEQIAEALGQGVRAAAVPLGVPLPRAARGLVELVATAFPDGAALLIPPALAEIR